MASVFFQKEFTINYLTLLKGLLSYFWVSCSQCDSMSWLLVATEHTISHSLCQQANFMLCLQVEFAGENSLSQNRLSLFNHRREGIYFLHNPYNIQETSIRFYFPLSCCSSPKKRKKRNPDIVFVLQMHSLQHFVITLYDACPSIHSFIQVFTECCEVSTYWLLRRSRRKCCHDMDTKCAG